MNDLILFSQHDSLRHRTGSDNSQDPNGFFQRFFEDSAEYPNMVVAIYEWPFEKNKDTIEYWNRSYLPMDKKKIKSKIHFSDQWEFQRRINPESTKVHSILMTNPQLIDENLYSVNLQVSVDQSLGQSKNSIGIASYRFVMVVYYPLATLPSLMTNVFVLWIAFVVFLFSYKLKWRLSREFHIYFLWGMGIMTVVYSSLALPGCFQYFGGYFPEGKQIANLIRIAPDNAFFLMAGLFLIRGPKNGDKRLLGILIILHILVNSPELVFSALILLRRDSMFFVPYQFLREFPPQIYGCISFIVVGVGIYRRGTNILDSLTPVPSGMYTWFKDFLASVFLTYGILQPFYLFRNQVIFFDIALILKFLAFFGVVLFTNMELVLDRFKASIEDQKMKQSLAEDQAKAKERQQLIAETVLKESPVSIIVFDDEHRIVALSEITVHQLDFQTARPGNLVGIVYDGFEWDLLSRLGKAREKQLRFLLDLKNKKNERRHYIANYTPVGTGPLHLLVAFPLSEAELKEFAQGISGHLLRADVQLIENHFDALIEFVRDNWNEKFREHPKAKNVQEAITIVNDSLSKKNPGDKTRFGESKSFNVCQVLHEIGSLEKQPRFRNINLKLRNHLSPSEIYVRHDKSLLMKNIEELLTNAYKKFDQNTGTVEITFEESPDHIKITFQDSGTPIPDEILAKLSSPSPYVLQPDNGLDSIKWNMNLFGGDLLARNEDTADFYKKPTFQLIIRKIEEKKNV